MLQHPSAHEVNSSNIRLWAQQVDVSGRRQFFKRAVAVVEGAIVGSQQPPSLYEIIGPHLLIRPYFDIEYWKPANRSRAASLDDQLLQGIVVHADSLLSRVHRVNIDREKLVVLDSSSADKFSVHLILPLSGGYGFAVVTDAKAFAQAVCSSLPSHILKVHTADGSAVSAVDLNCYHHRQQMRLLGCCKLGDTRTLRPHRLLGPAVACLADTLICAPQLPGRVLSMAQASTRSAAGLCAAASTADAVPLADASRSQHAQATTLTTSTSTHCSPHALPQLAAYLRTTLHASVRSIHMHARLGNGSPSLFLHTDSKTCAVRTHASNHAVVEVRLDVCCWRLLCRDGCAPGQWRHLSAALLHAADTSPEWLCSMLKQYVTK